jgi:CheY-like chemotaxis protein
MSNTPKNDDDLNLAPEDDELNLADEDDPLPSADEATDTDLKLNPSAPTWKVMIVDDEPGIHDATQLALAGFVFKGKPINFISAYSAEEAKSLLKAHPDTALIFLDVVMEENDSGLQLANYIRDTLQNHIVRIILRTGQPGEAPEEDVLLNYDINDYRLKVDLTQGQLFVAMIVGLRAYYDLMSLEIKKMALKQILDIMPIGVCVQDAPHGQPTYLNQRGQQILGKGIDKTATVENIAQVYQFYVAGTSQLYPSEKLPSACALKGKSTHVENIEIHQGEKMTLIESWGQPVFDDKKNVTCGLIIFQDITARHES